jgi:hypothetical protein
MYFVFMYKNGTMKPAEIVLKREKEKQGRKVGEDDLIRIYCKHICKCLNVSLCTTTIC